MTSKDIEELGWEKDLTVQNDVFKKYYKGNYVLGYDFKNYLLGMIVADLSKCDNYLRNLNDPSIRNLIVKTKEELQVLMIQFGIDE